MKNDIGPMKDRNDNDLQKKETSQEEIKIVKFLKKERQTESAKSGIRQQIKHWELGPRRLYRTKKCKGDRA